MKFHHMAGEYDVQGETITHHAHAPCEQVPPSELPHESLTFLLQKIKVEAPNLREMNLRITKQQIRENVKPDLLIINTSNAIEELDKVANALVKRLREWYALYDPELEHSYRDHKAFVEAVLTRTSQRNDETMGGEIAEVDIAIILQEAATVQQLYVQREELLTYLERIMDQHTKNVKALAGATIGAKLLAMAGSLERLSRLPSSTIQLLGAETALFRHLRNKKSKPPKHGIIFNHVLLQRAPRPMRGKVARALADKISIAAKLDYFKGEFMGDKLYRQVEEKANS
jgi:nucleolar protein 56